MLLDELSKLTKPQLVARIMELEAERHVVPVVSYDTVENYCSKCGRNVTASVARVGEVEVYVCPDDHAWVEH